MRGFTLVETLVAITVIATAMVVPLYSVQQSLNISRVARDQLIASSLAQEGIEYVREMRDSNYITNASAPGSRTWLAGIDGTQGGTQESANCQSPNVCYIDFRANEVTRNGGVLYLDSNNLYNQENQGLPTVFRRTLTYTSISATEVNLVVTVSWTTKGMPYTFTISERLHDWL